MIFPAINFYLGMDQYLLIPFLMGWTFTSYFDVHQGYKVLTHCHFSKWQNTLKHRFRMSESSFPSLARLVLDQLGFDAIRVSTSKVVFKDLIVMPPTSPVIKHQSLKAHNLSQSHESLIYSIQNLFKDIVLNDTSRPQKITYSPPRDRLRTSLSLTQRVPSAYAFIHSIKPLISISLQCGFVWKRDHGRSHKWHSFMRPWWVTIGLGLFP
jgi:hypothetical protein